MGNSTSSDQVPVTITDDVIDIYDDDLTDISFSEEVMTLNNESKRNIVSWLPLTSTVKKDSSVKAIILIAHGLNEHSLRHSEMAHNYAKLGYAVYAIDHYAHGKSDGVKGIITDYHVLYKDFIEFSEYVQSKHTLSLLPVYLFSHSMGTLIAVMALNKINNLKAVIFSSPPFKSGPGVSSPFGFRCLYPITQTSVAITLTSLLASIDPSGAAAPLLQEEITSDINDLMKLKKDKRMGPNYVTNKSAYEVLKLVDNSKLEIKNIKIPVLIIHGSIDQISLLEGSQYLYDNIDNSNNTSSDESNNSNSSDSNNDDKNSDNNSKDKNKQIIVIPEGKHELLHEVTEIKTYAMNIVINYIENQFNNSLAKKE